MELKQFHLLPGGGGGITSLDWITKALSSKNLD
jgi:hypothetical protein